MLREAPRSNRGKTPIGNIFDIFFHFGGGFGLKAVGDKFSILSEPI